MQYGEFLFDTDSENVMEALMAVDDEDIRDCAGYQVYTRGHEYYEEGMVEQLGYYRASNTVFAEVLGSREYQVEYYLDGTGIYSSCDCPYNGVCKHTVAALFAIMHDGIHSIFDSEIFGKTTIESLDFLRKHLEGYSKKDLIQLVMKFAPQNYISEIHNREVRAVDAGSICINAEQKIRGFFKNDELLMDPGAMEGAIMTQLSSVKGLEGKQGNQIGSLLLFIIRSIEDAFNEGYLYVDYYQDDDYFESEEFCEYVIAYVKQLSFENKMAFIPLLDQALNEMSYTTFNDIADSYARFFPKSEKTGLKQMLTSKPGMSDSMVSRLYGFLESELDIQEKEVLLRRISEHETGHFISLCQLLQEQERYKEVVDLVREHLVGRNYPEDSKLIYIYLESAFELNEFSEETVEEAVEKCPRAEVLEKIKELNGEVSARCEHIVKNWRAGELLIYYEKENRLDDALALVLEPKQLHEQEVLAFFRKYGKQFPSQAVAFLNNRIEENLKHAGKTYYLKIAESLDLLRRLNPERAADITGEIRTNYKRRPNLIAMIR